MKSSTPSLWGTLALAFLASAVVHVVLVLFSAPAILNGELIDTDAYMRLVRVRELAQGGAWFDAVVDRSNWPYGEALHWTRPFDALILAGAGLLTPLLGFETALYWAGALVSPVLQVGTSVALAWAAVPLVGDRLRPLLAIAVLAQPAFMGYALPGRPDHHILLILCTVVTLGAAVRVAHPDHTARADLWALGTGILAALGLWLSTELMLPLAAVLSVAGLAWVAQPERWNSVNAGVAKGLLLGTAIGLVIERRPADWLQVEYDRLSIVHVGLAAALVAAWAVLGRIQARGTPGRLLQGALAGGAVTGALVGLFPDFLGGPLATMDPRLHAVWYDRITEVEPLWPTSLWEAGRLIAYLGPALVAPVLTLVWAVRAPAARWAWALWSSVATAYATMALLYNVRFASGAEVLAIPAILACLPALYRYAEQMRMRMLATGLRATAAATLLVGPIFVGGAVMGADADSEPQFAGLASCDLQELGKWMEDEPTGARTILTFLDFGPELLYRTQHRVVAGPFYRNAAGILDIHDAFTTSDAQRREGILREREVDWVLLCPARDRGVFDVPGGLYASLMSDEPGHFERVPLPAPLSEEFLLFEVSDPELVLVDDPVQAGS